MKSTLARGGYADPRSDTPEAERDEFERERAVAYVDFYQELRALGKRSVACAIRSNPPDQSPFEQLCFRLYERIIRAPLASFPATRWTATCRRTMRRCDLSCGIEQRFVLKLVAAEAPRKCVLRPDDLAAHLEAAGLQRILELALPGR